MFFFFHNLTSKDLTLDLSCTENTSSQSNSRGLLWEYGGGEKAEKKNLSPIRKKKPSDGTAQRVGKQLAQWPYTLHLSSLVFRLPFYGIFSSLTPNGWSYFFLFHPHLHFQYAVKLHRGLLFGYFFSFDFFLDMCNRTTYDIHDSMFMFLIFSLLVAQSKRQPWILTEMKLGAKKRRPNW